MLSFMLLSRLLTLLLCLALAIALPARTQVTRRDTTAAWIQKREIPLDASIPFKIALKQSHLEQGAFHLGDISDPSSPNYGKHWTESEVHKAFAPSQKSVSKTMAWLQEFGIDRSRVHHSLSRGFLELNATFLEIEQLFGAKYALYKYRDVAGYKLGTEEYFIPSAISDHVEFISPGLVGLSLSRTTPISHSSLQKRQSICPPLVPDWSLKDCWEQGNPSCINALYGIPDSPPKKNDDTCGSRKSNKFGIFQLNVTAVPSDMELFFEKVFPKIPRNTVAENNFINGVNITETFNSSMGLAAESNLDFQIAWPLMYPHNITQYSGIPTDGQIAQYLASGNTNSTQALISALLSYTLEDVFASFDNTLCNSTSDSPCGIYERPSVLSISYVAYELDMEEAVAHRVCNEIMKLGLQGTTVLVASGDSGVTLRNNVCAGPDNTTFISNGIAACPFVTSVGATMLPDPSTLNESCNTNSTIPTPKQEIAAFQPIYNFSSSGGFSTYFNLPKYQESAVGEYLKANPSPYKTYNYNGSASSIGRDGGRYNARGRGIPDVSALGTNLTVVYDGCVSNAGGGTSAATPIFAALIWRINEERARIGKGPVGFINPVLYKHPEVLHDVTKGRNAGCKSDGFAAVKGWDPVTGLGTPNYHAMLELFLKLP